MRIYVGKCVECGGRMFYNQDEEKLEVKNRGPSCLCHFDWPKEEEEEEDELLQEYGEEEELKDIILPLNYAKKEEKDESNS